MPRYVDPEAVQKLIDSMQEESDLTGQIYLVLDQVIGEVTGNEGVIPYAVREEDATAREKQRAAARITPSRSHRHG